MELIFFRITGDPEYRRIVTDFMKITRTEQYPKGIKGLRGKGSEQAGRIADHIIKNA
jgi:hypothetical protein